MCAELRRRRAPYIEQQEEEEAREGWLEGGWGQAGMDAWMEGSAQ